jgi:hypothetical protein
MGPRQILHHFWLNTNARALQLWYCNCLHEIRIEHVGPNWLFSVNLTFVNGTDMLCKVAGIPSRPETIRTSHWTQRVDSHMA